MRRVTRFGSGIGALMIRRPRRLAHLATPQAEERIEVAAAAGSALTGCHAVFSAVTADQAVPARVLWQVWRRAPFT